LELSGVGKGYGKGDARSEVLADIDLSVERGELVCMVGSQSLAIFCAQTLRRRVLVRTNCVAQEQQPA